MMEGQLYPTVPQSDFYPLLASHLAKPTTTNPKATKITRSEKIQYPQKAVTNAKPLFIRFDRILSLSCCFLFA